MNEVINPLSYLVHYRTHLGLWQEKKGKQIPIPRLVPWFFVSLPHSPTVKITMFQSFSHVKSPGWWFQPLWKILASWAYYSQYMESQKKSMVPNHQPDILLFQLLTIINHRLTIRLTSYYHHFPIIFSSFSHGFCPKMVPPPRKGARWTRPCVELTGHATLLGAFFCFCPELNVEK